jgi:hypothetical protein
MDNQHLFPFQNVDAYTTVVALGLIVSIVSASPPSDRREPPRALRLPPLPRFADPFTDTTTNDRSH